MQVCDDGFTASCVGCCVSTLPALWCEEAIPRTSKLEKRGSKGREGREDGHLSWVMLLLGVELNSSGDSGKACLCCMGASARRGLRMRLGEVWE